jgi:hypothetical protein
MIRHAQAPERLHFSVCWQDDEDVSVFHDAGFTSVKMMNVEGHDVHCYAFLGARIDIISINYFLSRGACWARHISEKLFAHEDYFLQIDSHCRFVPNWDQEMIDILCQLQQHHALPLISTYPPPFEPGEDEEASKKTYISRLSFREFNTAGIPMLTSASFVAEEPVRGSYIAAGFIFTTGSFVKDVRNDPQIFFAGEEIAMAVRAFTHGYSVFHPHKLLLWHFYGRKGFSKVWGDHSNEAKEKGNIEKAWWEWDNVSKKRVRTLLGLEEADPAEMEPYGLGLKKTLRQFEYQAGIDIAGETVLPECTTTKRVAFFDTPPDSEEEWLARHVGHFKKLITIKQSECNTEDPQIEYLHISAYGQDDIQLYEDQIFPAGLATLRTKTGDGNIIINIEFSCAAHLSPKEVRFTPWLKDTGWGSVVEKKW